MQSKGMTYGTLDHWKVKNKKKNAQRGGYRFPDRGGVIPSFDWQRYPIEGYSYIWHKFLCLFLTYFTIKHYALKTLAWVTTGLQKCFPVSQNCDPVSQYATWFPKIMTQFPENVTWFSKIYDKLYDKKILGILIGNSVSRIFDPISWNVTWFSNKKGPAFSKKWEYLFFRTPGHIFRKLGHIFWKSGYIFWKPGHIFLGNQATILGNQGTILEPAVTPNQSFKNMLFNCNICKKERQKNSCQIYK